VGETMQNNATSRATSRTKRSVADLSHGELGVLAREYLLAGHLIDRAGMPLVTAMGLDVMTEVAIDEWMGASPIYTKRMQGLLGFEGDTVEVALKGMQLDIGAPPEFMDFRMAVQDDRHGTFHLDHCGALMDVEPMGDDFVIAMCHHIEDPPSTPPDGRPIRNCGCGLSTGLLATRRIEHPTARGPSPSIPRNRTRPSRCGLSRSHGRTLRDSRLRSSRAE